MANTIRIKRRPSSGSAGSPSAASLYNGELAFNENDNILYYAYGSGVGGISTAVPAIAGSGAYALRGGTNATGIWPISIDGTAAYATNAVYTTGNQTIEGTKTFYGSGTNGSSVAIKSDTNYPPSLVFMEGSSLPKISFLWDSSVNKFKLVTGSTPATAFTFQVNTHLEVRATGTSSSATNIPVFISNPNSSAQTIYTRTPSELKSDIGLSNVENLALSGITFTAGSGLVGGGTLAANRTFDINTGDGIQIVSDAVAVDSTVVRTTGAQTIAGVKTFISDVVIGDPVAGKVTIYGSGVNEGKIVGSTSIAIPNATFSSELNAASLLTVNGGGVSFKVPNTSSNSVGYFAVFDSNPSGTLTQIKSVSKDQILDDIGAATSGLDITAGSGLVGGGTLSENRRFDVGQGDGISVSNNAIAVDSTVVRTTGTQSIDGLKSFSSLISFNNNANFGTGFQTAVSLGDSFGPGGSGAGLMDGAIPLATEYWSGSDSIIHYAYGGGTLTSPRIAVLETNGNVGIGISTPSAKLHVNGSGIFASGLNIGNQTASTIASFDSNKNVVSLSTDTYPSLTELSYAKGVTSAIQTQIDGKVATSDSTVVRTTGTQTINGSKTFGNKTVFQSGIQSNLIDSADGGSITITDNIIIQSAITTIEYNPANGDYGAFYDLDSNRNVLKASNGVSILANNTSVSGTYFPVWTSNPNTSAEIIDSRTASQLKGDIGLSNVTNDAQIKKLASTSGGYVPTWNGTTGDALNIGYSVETTLTGGTSSLPRADAVKTYVDSMIGSGIATNDAMIFKGTIDCSGNPNYPAADRGWTYKVSVAGKIGGASGPVVEVNDTIICGADGVPSGTHASVGSNWNILQTNIADSSILVTGPSSATSGNVAMFDGSTGKIIKDGGFLVSDIARLSNSQTFTGVNSFGVINAGYQVNGDPAFTIYNDGDDITFRVMSGGSVTVGTWSAETIAVDKGGTGQTSYTNGQLLIGNSTGNTLTKATLTQGTAIDITNSTGSITIGHNDTSTLTGAQGSNGIASFTVDGMGHVTAVTTATYLTSGESLCDAISNSNCTIDGGTF
jgi:hypothetical protein